MMNGGEWLQLCFKPLDPGGGVLIQLRANDVPLHAAVLSREMAAMIGTGSVVLVNLGPSYCPECGFHIEDERGCDRTDRNGARMHRNS